MKLEGLLKLYNKLICSYNFSKKFSNNVNSTSSNKTEFFNADYYLNGPKTGKSCYVNYSWKPEISVPQAEGLSQYLGFSKSDSILDYGCARGYLVKALKALGFNAKGVDVSEWAINNSEPSVRKELKAIKSTLEIPNAQDSKKKFDWLVSLDVFEHIPAKELKGVLRDLHSRAKKVFAVIPLAKTGLNGCFVTEDHHEDPSHVTILDKYHWIKLFKKAGWNLEKYTEEIPNLKEKWTKQYPGSYGFFTLKS